MIPSYASLLTLVLFGLTPVLATGQDKDGKDDVVGTIWKFTMTNGPQKETGQFRVHKHVVYKGAKKVGLIEPKGLQTTLIINDFPKLNGRVELTKVKAKPPVWRGTYHRSDGTKWNIEVEVKDQ
jgi:hypothetical protein